MDCFTKYPSNQVNSATLALEFAGNGPWIINLLFFVRYVGNLHKNATENVLKALFAVIGNVVDVKMINDAALSANHYCFITYETHICAQRALAAMNGREVYKMPLKVNWATRPDGIKKDTSSNCPFVVLWKQISFRRGPSHICGRSGAGTDDFGFAKRVREVWWYLRSESGSRCTGTELFQLRILSTKTNRSKGYGFVAFLKKESAEKAISEMNNKSIGGREVRTNWATSRKIPVRD